MTHVIVIQIMGDRRWEYNHNADDSPPRARQVLPHESMDYSCGLPLANEGRERLVQSGQFRVTSGESVLLRPGMGLFLPSGCAHKAISGSEPSIHLTFGVHHFRALDLFLVAVQRLGARHKEFRAPVFFSSWSKCSATSLIPSPINWRPR
jgi:ribosomal protein L16 Arg81 hydroxylase